MISVIIPCYNSEKTIIRAISSLENTSFSDYEIIVVNDGSKDTSSELIKQYQSNHPKIVLIEKPNEGVVKAVTAGIKKAKGDAITFLDSDDYVNKDYLANIASLYAGFDVLALGHRQINENGEEIKEVIKTDEAYIGKAEVHKLINKLYFDNHSFSAFKYVSIYRWSTIISKEIADNIVDIYERENFTLYEDMCFNMLAIANATKVKISSYVGVNYVQMNHSHSSSHESSYKDLLALRRHIHSFLDYYCKTYGLSPEIFSTVDFDVSKFYFSRYLRSHNFKDAKSFFKELKHDKDYQSQRKLVNISGEPLMRKVYYYFLRFNWFLPIYFYFK